MYRKTVFDLEYDCEIIIGINRLAITESEYALLKAIVCANHGEIRFSVTKWFLSLLYRTMFCNLHTVSDKKTLTEIIGLSQDGREVLEQYQAMYRKSLLSLALATRGPLEVGKVPYLWEKNY